MDSKKVGAMIAAIDKGSLTAAAAELGYTQSGLTHMMNSLEDELGLNLLIRGKSGVRLSAEGQMLLPKLRAFTNAAAELEQEADRLRRLSVSSLRIGAYSSVAALWLPDILKQFRLVCPEIRVSVTMNGIEALYDAVKSDRLDLALVSFQAPMMQGLNWSHIRDDALLAVLPPEQSPDAEAYSVADFDGQDFLMPSQGFELDIAPVFSSGGRQHISPEISHTNMDDASIVSMVAHGLGVSILSELVMQNLDGRKVRTLPLSPEAHRSLGIIVNERKANDRCIRRFMSCAKATVDKKYAE